MKSTQGDCIVPSRKGKHINESERQQIEYWRIKGKSITEIATLLQRHRSTIHRELKRGTVTNKRSDLTEYQVYRAQRAQDDYVLNANRLIRRLLPKKTTFDTLTQNDINRLAEWMNRYPRRIFKGKSARLMARTEKLHFIKFTA